MSHDKDFNINMYCCTTFSESNDVVIAFKNLHDVCENFTRKVW